jgi:hypothetical protein
VCNRRLWKLVQLVEPEGEEAFKAKVGALLGIDLRIEPSARHHQFAVLYTRPTTAKS